MYSHRNGESEPPTIRGLYWFAGQYLEEGETEPTEYYRLYNVTVNVNRRGENKWWAFKWESHPQDRARDTDALNGRWWGPVILPWQEPAAAPVPAPTIVCLCGSTRFWREFQRASLAETLAGKIVLSIGSASGTDEEHFGHLSQEEHDRIIEQLNELHFRKIELADEVLILNLGGYIGMHTTAELAYARKLGKTVRFLEPEQMQQRQGSEGN